MAENLAQRKEAVLYQIEAIADITLKGKRIIGGITKADLERRFSTNDPTLTDGFYRITDLEAPTAGNIIRIGSDEGCKTLWYPTNTKVADTALDDVERLIRNSATVQEMPILGKEDRTRGYGEDWEEYCRELDELYRRYVFVDLGCGDFRVGLVAAFVHQMRAVGVELDPVMAGMSKRNIRETQQWFMVGDKQVRLVEGSFSEQRILEDVFARREKDRFICYINLGPVTQSAVSTIAPFLRKGDYVVSYKERILLLDLPAGEREKFEIKREASPYMGDPINIYFKTKD